MSEQQPGPWPPNWVKPRPPRRPHRRPRWVTVLGVIGAVAVVLVIVMLFTGHGPGRHMQHGLRAPGAAAERPG